MERTEEESWNNRYLRALDRTEGRINAVWEEFCQRVPGYGLLCGPQQLFAFYYVDWLQDRLGSPVEPGTILDNVLSRVKTHMGCEYLPSPPDHSFWEAHNQHLETRDGLLMTPLHVAASRGCLPCIKALLEKGVQSHLLDIFGRTALVIASAAGYDKVVAYLAKLDQPRRKLDPLEQDPVVAAAANGQYATILVLKELGYSPEDRAGWETSKSDCSRERPSRRGRVHRRAGSLFASS